MALLFILALSLAVVMFLPSIRDTFLYIVLCAFSFPVLTFTGGTIGWIALNLVTGFSHWTAESWLNSCCWIGLPIATVGSWWIRRSHRDT